MREHRGTIKTVLLVAAVTASTLVASAAVAAAPSQAKVAKGIIDAALEAQPAGSTATPGMIREIDRGLGADWIRLTANWAALEPQQGEYAPAEVDRLDKLVKGLHAAGVKIILTTCYAPTWAQDSSLWGRPPAGTAKGPQSFYAIRSGAMDDYGRLGTFLARRYKGRVQALECWNEPNLWCYVYPQRVAGDPYFGARVYLRMLRAFHAGVHRARTGVRVVAGATAPVGLNDVLRTSPQRFARFLRRSHAGRYFDVYSHHPYTPGGSLYPAPGQPPNDPSTTVTLGNLRTLLKLFPQEALLRHGVRLQHASVHRVRRLRGLRGRPGTLPAAGVSRGRELPPGQAAGVVPAAGRGQRHRRRGLRGPAPAERRAQAGLVRLPAPLRLSPGAGGRRGRRAPGRRAAPQEPPAPAGPAWRQDRRRAPAAAGPLHRRCTASSSGSGPHGRRPAT